MPTIWESVGELELKALPEPVPALQLEWTPAEEDSPGLAVPLPTRLAVQTGLVPLVGRRAEREAMRDALKVASAGERGVILITGEAGLGKTRLAAEFASEAFEAGATVLYGRCDEELSVPYLPWVEALSPLVELADEGLISPSAT